MTTTLNPTTSSVTLWASDFEQGSSCDNCTPYRNLKMRIRLGSGTTVPLDSSITFNCSLLGQRTIQLWIGDGGYDENNNGIIEDSERNWDYCTSYIIVNNNMNAPCNDDRPLIAGRLTNESQIGLANTVVNVGNAMQLQTDADGYYNGAGLVQNMTYEVKPYRNNDPLNGVSTLDLVYIRKHILDIQVITSPYRRIAADVNNSGTITTLDIVALRKLILNIDTQFANNTSWRFVPKDYHFADNGVSVPTGFPEYKMVTALAGINEADFIAIKIGDINGTADPAHIVGSENRSSSYNFNVKDHYFSKGDVVKVALDIDRSEVIGLQGAFNFNNGALTYKGISSTTTLEDFTESNLAVNSSNGIMRFSWNNYDVNAEKQTLVLEFVAKSDGLLSEMFGISNANIANEIYISQGKGEQAVISTLDLGIKFNGNVMTTVSDRQMTVLQNKPNPFSNETVISFTLPSASDVTFSIFDLNGRVLNTFTQYYEAGIQQVKVKRSDLQNAGIYYYNLKCGETTITKRMILVD